MLDFSNPFVRENAQKQKTALLSEAYSLITIGLPGAKDFYNEETHRFLMKHAWEVIIPASEEEIPPLFEKLHFDEQMPWPQMTAYAYATSTTGIFKVPWLMVSFGYAVLGDKLIKTAFFTHQKLVDYQPMPQGIAIDPLAKLKGIQPDYYVGMPVCSEQYLAEFPALKQHPFERYVHKDGHLMM